ncbi:MAG: hypothetical protein QM831_35380 [Kofleriaceae bacterium]
MRSPLLVNVLAWIVAVIAGAIVMITGIALVVHYNATTRGLVAACGMPLSLVAGPLLAIELRRALFLHFTAVRLPVARLHARQRNL